MSGLIGCLGVTQTVTLPTTAPGAPNTPIEISTPLPSPQASPTSETKSNALPSTTRETTPTPESGNVITDPTLLKLITDAKADLSTRANVGAGSIKVKIAEAVEWPDTSLGCPKPGMMYAQMITPGYKIVLEAGGHEWNYHASMDRVMWCDK